MTSCPNNHVIIKAKSKVLVIQSKSGIDIKLTQRSKLLADIPPVDIVITMGCNVNCPFLYREDWGIDDPTGKSDEEFIKIIESIENKVKQLSVKLSK